MGRSVAALIADRTDIALASAYGRTDAVRALSECEVIIDFSTASASAALAARAGAQGRPALVIGATGLTAAEERTIKDASHRTAIVKSGNFSLGINLLAALLEQAAARLGPEDWDIEILEVHHRGKTDAPSGTALMLGEAAARGRGTDVARRDAGVRAKGNIGFASLRAGGIVGEHQVLIASDDEVITLGHSARDRAVFARGALAAAIWVRGRPPGLYGMKDVLGF
jgi:4-hydroxy-tetrahydrodipicolinate reductase